jgi:hypothetical protein
MVSTPFRACLGEPGGECVEALPSPDPNRRTAFASRTMAAGCACLDAAAIHCCSDAAKNQQPKSSGQHYLLPVESAENED